MKKIFILALLACALAFPATAVQKDRLSLSLQLTTGEHSPDSNAQTVLITLADDQLTYEQTFSGYGADSRTPVHREFKLKGSEIARLKSLIKERNLLGTGGLKFTPAPGQFNYFEMTIKVTLKGIIATQELSGPRAAANIKAERVYQKSLALMQELYRLINLRDKEIRYEEPVN
jgi:hypothetical protein